MPNRSFVALVLLCFVVRFNLVSPPNALMATFCYETLSLIYFSVAVVSQMCTELGIRCFHITIRHTPAAKRL